MNSRETRRYDIFVRVQTFGTDNSADFAPASTAATNFATVTTVVNGLNTAKAGQKPGRDTSKEVLLDAIRLDIQNITRTAAAIDQTTPGFADSFRPPAQFNPNALLTTADKFISQLAPQPGDSAATLAATLAAKTALVAQFTAHEMPANFVAALQADRAAYGTDITQRETKRETGVGNTATIGTLIAQGMKAVTTLDAIMHNKYASQPAKMAAWLTAAHIERDAQRGTTPTPPPATPHP
jgi:hypothetical protein